MASGPDASVQMPKDFDKAGRKLLMKVAELSCKLGGHALAAYADARHDLHYYASIPLQGLVVEQQLLDFLRQQLVEQYHGSQLMTCDFVPLDSSGVPLLTAQKQRLDAWDQRMPTLQHLAQAISDLHPDRAFFVFTLMGPSPNNISSYTFTSSRLHGMLLEPIWTQLLDSVKALPAELSSNVPASAPAVRQCRPKQPRQQQSAVPAQDTGRSKKRKLIAGSMQEPGTAAWYNGALLISPAAYQTPLPNGAWALPDVNSLI
ncbi:hypothetical protein ABBQ38_008784 [Trebouxia sp. C0009 RCD-2024]